VEAKNEDGAEVSKRPSSPGRVRTAGIVIVLAAVLLVFVGPRILRKFEEPPVVDVSDILRGDVEQDIVLIRGIVQSQGREQGYLFLGDLEETDEIVVEGISMLPVVRVHTWGWFHSGQEVRLPVRIERDEQGNILLVEVRRRGEDRERRTPGAQPADGASDST
jgi:hypothetical protein